MRFVPLWHPHICCPVFIVMKGKLQPTAHLLLCFFLLSAEQIYRKLNQSSITVLHMFYLVTSTGFDPYLDHHGAEFLNTSLVSELSWVYIRFAVQ
jgi:hypothetical protein